LEIRQTFIWNAHKLCVLSPSSFLAPPFSFPPCSLLPLCSLSLLLPTDLVKVSIVPVLHGANEPAAWSICKSGFAALSSLVHSYSLGGRGRRQGGEAARRLVGEEKEVRRQGGRDGEEARRRRELRGGHDQAGEPS
jgi:hypothetical protein